MDLGSSGRKMQYHHGRNRRITEVGEIEEWETRSGKWALMDTNTGARNVEFLISYTAGRTLIGNSMLLLNNQRYELA
jgi:hypothetical protein